MLKDTTLSAPGFYLKILVIDFWRLNVFFFRRTAVLGSMAYSVEKLLQDAATLVSRLKEHDAVADILISQTGNLHKRMEAMKEVSEASTGWGWCNLHSLWQKHAHHVCSGEDFASYL